MAIKDALLPEFGHELATTRWPPERLPAECQSRHPTSRVAIIEEFDAEVTSAQNQLPSATHGELMTPWTRKKGGRGVFTVPRIRATRSFLIRPLSHHRGQLTVYLRLK